MTQRPVRIGVVVALLALATILLSLLVAGPVTKTPGGSDGRVHSEAPDKSTAHEPESSTAATTEEPRAPSPAEVTGTLVIPTLAVVDKLEVCATVTSGRATVGRIMSRAGAFALTYPRALDSKSTFELRVTAQGFIPVVCPLWERVQSIGTITLQPALV